MILFWSLFGVCEEPKKFHTLFLAVGNDYSLSLSTSFFRGVGLAGSFVHRPVHRSPSDRASWLTPRAGKPFRHRQLHRPQCDRWILTRTGEMIDGLVVDEKERQRLSARRQQEKCQDTKWATPGIPQPITTLWETGGFQKALYQHAETVT